MARDTDAVRAQIERLRRLVSSPSGPGNDFLAPVMTGSEFAAGSTVSLLQQRFAERPSGLLVPLSVAAEPQPIDHVKVYLLADEMLGESVPIEAVLESIAGTPLEVAIQWCATWLARLRGPGSNQAEVDRLFATSHLTEPHRTRVLNLLRVPMRVLVTPQGLFCVAKLALALSATRGKPDEPDDKHVALALIGLMEYLGAGSLDEIDDEIDDEIMIDGTPGALGREVIANQLANSNRQEAGRWAAFEECWFELPKQLAEHPRVIDLPQAFEAATGAALDDLVVICGSMWASVVNGKPHLASSYFDKLGWTSERLNGVLDLICGSPEQLRDELREEIRTYGLTWSMRTLERFPVVRWENGELTVIDPELLVDRATGAWPLFDALRCLEDAGDQKAASKLRGAYDHVIENYAREIIRGLVGSGTGANRLFDEDDLRRAYGRKNQVADIVVDYGHAWLVADATTTGLQALTMSGTSDESVMEDVEKVVRKARQIDATIVNLRADEAKLTGSTSSVHRRFFPAIVVSSRFVTGPIFMALLRQRLEAEGLLQGHDVAPLEVMEFEDLDVAEGLLESTGTTLIQLLEGKERSAHHGMPLRDYVMVGLGRLDVPRPARIESAWPRWLRRAETAWRFAEAEAGHGE